MLRPARLLTLAACFAVLSCSSLALAQSASASRPATQPATTRRAAAAVKPKIAVIHLTSTLTERPADFSLALLTGGSDKAPSLSNLITLLNKAAKDSSLAGVLLELKGFDLTLSQAQDIGSLMTRLRAANKKVTVFAASFDTPTYVLASYADTVVMPENGDVMMPGVQMGLLFFRGLLDKLSLQPDFVQVGKFKGAEEPFTRTEASPEFKQQIDALADGFYDQIVATLSANRKQLSAQAVKDAIDEGWIPGKRAHQLKLIDRLMTREQVEEWCADQTPSAELVEDYGSPRKKNLDLDNPFAILSLLGDANPKPRANQPAVAVIYADGTITEDSPDGIGDDSVTPARMRKAIEKALDDDLVKALVLRIDSPGGSATASDEIWQILKEADRKKPLTVSMGRMAASGGYYIACAGRSISAEPATITGSIGVVGGKIVFKGLLDKIGVNIQPVSRGKHANMLSSMTPFTEEERTFIRGLMTETYDLFTSRVKAGRGDKIKQIEEVAQGRLFTGAAAKQAGLVDEVRTLPDAIQAAAAAAGIDKNYQILVYPEQKTLADILRESFQIDARLPLEVSAALRASPPALQREATKVLNLMHILQQERVMLALPVGILEN